MVEYLRAVEAAWGIRIARIGIDAPRLPRQSGMALRACETALKERGISYYETPGRDTFDRIPGDFATYQADKMARKGQPFGGAWGGGLARVGIWRAAG